MTAQTADLHHIGIAPLAEAPGFAAVLRERTQAIHREAERSGYIADLLRGRATRFGYAVYLASLLPAYEAMEQHLAVDSPIPALRAFAVPGLARSAALRHDLQALDNPADGALPVLPEAKKPMRTPSRRRARASVWWPTPTHAISATSAAARSSSRSSRERSGSSRAS